VAAGNVTVTVARLVKPENESASKLGVPSVTEVHKDKSICIATTLPIVPEPLDTQFPNSVSKSSRSPAKFPTAHTASNVVSAAKVLPDEQIVDPPKVKLSVAA